MMNKRVFGGLCAGLLALTGCSSTLVVAPHAPRCEVQPDLSTYKCTPPARVPAGTTYGGLVDVLRSDRQSLRECVINIDALRETLGRCNQAVDDYNKKVDEVNAQNRR